MNNLKYAVWNNKGGVGKTFVTFAISMEYAEKHPNNNVVVVDMCPQANVSEILLGGKDAGSKKLDGLLSHNPRKTVGGYLDERINSPHSKTGKEISYLVKLNEYNSNLPANAYLIAGDPSLEIQSQAINQIAAQTLPQDAWKNVHLWLNDLIDSISTELNNPVFFIDCNPSFSSYTELALVAADRLIIPCTADGSSARGIDNISQLLYGVNVHKNYSGVNFSSKAQNNGISLPSIHIVPLNRSTQYQKEASKAFGAMYGEIKARVNSLEKNKFINFGHLPIDRFIEIPDAHAVSVVASHLGLPLSKITAKKYEIHDVETQINKDSLLRYKTSIDTLVSRL